MSRTEEASPLLVESTQLYGNDKGDIARQEATREVEKRWRAKVVGGLFLYILIAVCFFCPTEQWSVVESVYFATVTLTTVGYGDLRPSKPGTKIFTCFFVFGGLGCIGALISKAISIIVMQQEDLIAEAPAIPHTPRRPLPESYLTP